MSDCTSGTELENLLCEVNAAIRAIVTGNTQSYGIGSRNLTYLSLSELMDMRKVLMAEIDGSIFINKATFRDC